MLSLYALYPLVTLTPIPVHCLLRPLPKWYWQQFMTYKRSARLRSNSFPISCLLSLVFLTPSNQILFALVWTDFYTSLPLAYQSDTSWYVSRHSSLAAKIKLTSNFLLYSIKSQGNVLLCREIQQVKSLWKKKFFLKLSKKSSQSTQRNFFESK